MAPGPRARRRRQRELLAACGKTPVVARQDREAASIVAGAIATADDVDTGARNGFGLRLPAYGILEHQDTVGLDLGLRVEVAPNFFNKPRAPEYFRGLAHRGDLGAKSGRGFHDWSVKSAAEVARIRDELLVEVLLYRRRNRAVRKPPQGLVIRELPDRELPG